MLAHHEGTLRTTITIDDGLLEQLKRRSSETGMSVSELIQQSVHRDLAARAATERQPRRFKLVTYGRGGRFSRFDIDRSAALLEIEDLELHGGRTP